jgi:hypothetical protein
LIALEDGQTYLNGNTGPTYGVIVVQPIIADQRFRAPLIGLPNTGSIISNNKCKAFIMSYMLFSRKWYHSFVPSAERV